VGLVCRKRKRREVPSLYQLFVVNVVTQIRYSCWYDVVVIAIMQEQRSTAVGWICPDTLATVISLQPQKHNKLRFVLRLSTVVKNCRIIRVSF